MNHDDEKVWYFAYGSNLEPDRFQERVGEWLEGPKAKLSDYALRFCGDVNAEGGGGVVIVPSLGNVLYGIVYRINMNQLQAMDAIEFHHEIDTERVPIRKKVTVKTDIGEIQVEVYTIPEPKTFQRPSEKYLDYIIRGLKSAGYS